MAVRSDQAANFRPRSLAPLTGIGGRAAVSALRPLTDATVRIGLSLDRHVVGRGLESSEPEGILTAELNDVRVQETLQRALASNGARQLIDSFFDSGLFDHFIERLAATDAFWRLVDEITQSPSVRAALSRQGLGFADQIGGTLRDRSHNADHRFERSAGRRTHRPPNGAPSDAGARTP
jgi:hypothetical protein